MRVMTVYKLRHTARLKVHGRFLSALERFLGIASLKFLLILRFIKVSDSLYCPGDKSWSLCLP